MKKKISEYAYEELRSTGFLFEFFPEATGDMKYDIEELLVYEIDLDSGEQELFDLNDLEKAFNAGREVEIIGYHNDIIRSKEKYKDFNDFKQKYFIRKCGGKL